MQYINFIFIFLPISIILYADSDRMTKGQFRFSELCRATEAQLSSNGKCSQEFIEQQVKPLLMESIEQGEIWDNTLRVPTIPSFDSFLVPELGKQPNPFFRYAVTIFLASDRFQNSELAFQQKSCFELVKMLCQEEYAEFHPFLTQMLFKYFHGSEYYGEDAQRWLEKMLVKYDLWNNPKVVLLFLFLPPQVYAHWLVQMTHLRPDVFDAIDSKNPLPQLVLILSVKYAEQNAMDKLTDALGKIDSSPEGIARAAALFPYLSLVRTPQMVIFLKKYLDDENIIDQGDDILHRNTGLSVLSAYSLYTMLEGFPEFSCHKFDHEDRKRCLEWFSQNEIYYFKPFDYWITDPIISRVRYMIFERD